MVLERASGFLGSPLTLTGLYTTSFEGTANGGSAFIAVDGEYSGVDEDGCEDGRSSGVETEWMTRVFLASSEFSVRGAGLCTVEQSLLSSG